MAHVHGRAAAPVPRSDARSSPFLAPAVGSLLFACVLFLFLVAARERQIGRRARPGHPSRKPDADPPDAAWSRSGSRPASTSRSSRSGAPADLPDDAADAWFRLMCGLGLLVDRPASSPASRGRPRRGPRHALFGRKAATGIGAAGDRRRAARGLCLALDRAGPAGIRRPASGRPAGSARGRARRPGDDRPRGRDVLPRLALGELLRLAPRLGLEAPLPPADGSRSG